MKSLASKLVKIMSEVDRIPKRGRNEFHKYDYAMAADVIDAMRQKFTEAGIMFLCSAEDVQREGTLTTVRMKFTLRDSETGETWEASWFGQGDDKGDKGVWKAYTGSIKYFLMGTFMIPTGDDPEADPETDTRHANASTQTRQRKPSTLGKATRAQLQQITGIAKDLGMEPHQLRSLANERYGADTSADLTADQAQQMIDYLKGLQDLGGAAS